MHTVEANTIEKQHIDPAAHPGEVSLGVVELRPAVQFYVDVLGLTLHALDSQTARLESVRGDRVLRLEAGASRGTRPARVTGLYHMAMLFPSRAPLGGALLRLAANGYPIQGASDHGVSEAIYLADPEGNGIELYADRPPSAWPRLNGTLAMVTDPLDLDSLLDEARRTGFTGREPVESLHMGHVHLHVSHLDPAVAFYREAVGLNLVQRYGGQAAFLAAGDYHHHIGINTWAGIGAPQPAPGSPGLREFTLLLPTHDALGGTVNRLRAHGQVVDSRQYDYLTRDPSGNTIVLHSEEE